ncbi:hypothetical protein P152DRAFT_458747 [Eremomyces bilateralis CBS 781.70]|uniref:Thymidylate kinase n=1 Tax=Eremomyces bilateralis CBS 781.70 TaxID=1392243 RepID=A0A6G1G2V2_9PEZI|nr:uncharacterized protein P152DRAFT_458747 [Eremomyces bilateralis CBS 781.70]KAF1812373.1 hypothetical protein P152DRAFT_458747 [Eremomyces bilateralis CBS 781.70]
MATIRQPFAELGTPRLQQLTSIKNRQNALTESLCQSAPAKPTMATFASPAKKRLAPLDFDEPDTENIDPTVFDSPSKRTKNIHGRAVKTPVSKFTLTSAAKASTLPSSKSLSLSIPSSTSTPISTSRASPKHKRIAHLSNRRVSSPSIRRVDPPRSRLHAPAATLPFSIDAALSGTLSKPPPPSEPKEVPMPTSWFFDIHVDTPEEEASNLMEHSAAVLDISSDDDAATRRKREELEERERGKENIPPPDFVAAVGNRNARGDVAVDASADLQGDAIAVAKTANRKWREKLAATAMDEDRNPLGDLKPSDFYDEKAELVHVVVEDNQSEQPCVASKVEEFEGTAPVVNEEGGAEPTKIAKGEEVTIFQDQ